jgi:hypothetical protein
MDLRSTLSVFDLVRIPMSVKECVRGDVFWSAIKYLDREGSGVVCALKPRSARATIELEKSLSNPSMCRILGCRSRYPAGTRQLTRAIWHIVVLANREVYLKSLSDSTYQSADTVGCLQALTRHRQALSIMIRASGN